VLGAAHAGLPAKARPFFHPPAWLSRAREAGGEPLELRARPYESISAISLALEAAIAMERWLFWLNVVSAGRALTAVRRFMVVSLVCSLAVFAVATPLASVAAGSSEDWRGAASVFLPVLPCAAVAVLFVLASWGR
jgi:hypothetical protein